MTEPLRPRGRKVKILATLGPASSKAEMIRKLMLAGADAFRINMSHGDQKSKAKLVDAIRALEKELRRPTTIVFDLQGPKLRVGSFEGGSAQLEKGAKVVLDQENVPGDAKRMELPHPELFAAIGPGDRLLIDDGKVRLKVIEAEEKRIVAEVMVGGTVSNSKGVNVPDVVVPIPALTEKDKSDLAFALEQGADWIALSFVQRPEDVAEARALIGDKAALMAKIEKPAAIERLPDIIALADGGEQLRVRQFQPRRIARRLVLVEDDALPLLELRRTAREAPDPKLRPLKVEDDGGRPPKLLFQRPDRFDQLRLRILVAVAHVDPKGVRPRQHQRPDHLGLARRGAEGREDLHFPGARFQRLGHVQPLLVRLRP